MSHVEDKPTLPKIEHSGDGSSSSERSSPEFDEQTFTQENAPVHKRKGGRKPIYATSEERKQRNRQAQAAFRERRTEYIKQLETTIKHHEETLQSLQQSHRSAADECLMLRYKNSLLERVLLEKGIDVQAELSSKTESPHLAPTKVAQPAGNQPSPVQRAIMNRHHQARRSLSGMPPKLVPGYAAAQSRQDGPFPSHSPQLQPTPPSHASSPIGPKSPGFVVQEGMNSPASDAQSQRLVLQQQQNPQPQQQRQQPHLSPRLTSQSHPRAYSGIAIPTSDAATHLMAHSTAGESRNGVGTDKPRPQSGYYPSHFQNHINQLGKLSRPLLSLFL
ncbi:MAG: hypothetical protein FRX48_08375 [Lasallia pustulata]|uniref:BZIP domain-containing protein n=1 Tax=Lasallia pustulata TaxID=136370 RepID=A0A5M8PGX6_9LECA|nr:MAG: hypothetical protein FRX48_08375 [Lasallia pustulata]